MKQNLLNRLVMLVVALVMVHSVWGEVVSGTTYTLTSGESHKGTPSGWTNTGDIASSYTHVKNGNYVSTSSICIKALSKIEINAGHYGGEGNTATLRFEWVTSSGAITLWEVTPSTNKESGSYSTTSFTTSPTANTEGYFKISAPNATASKYARLKAVKFTFTTGSCAVVEHNVNWYVNGVKTSTTQVAEGAPITLPTAPSAPAGCSGKSFYGWTTTANYSHATTAPSIISSPTMGTDDINYYAVFADVEEGTPTETKSQTLQYDTWSYSGSTTDKSSYRLFHSGSYIESAAFDLSTLSKVIVYGGTFGGGSYNSLTIGDGTNTWKSVTVSGSSQTGTNTYTDGTALSGTKKLRVTSNSGTATGTGVRISKVEIFTTSPAITYSNYATSCGPATYTLD